MKKIIFSFTALLLIQVVVAMEAVDESTVGLFSDEVIVFTTSSSYFLPSEL